MSLSSRSRAVYGTAIGTGLFAAAVAGALVLAPITLSDYSRAYFAPGEWRAIGGVEGTWAKTYWSEVYQDSFRIAHYPTPSLAVWLRPTHALSVEHGSGTDSWYAVDPVWRPSPDAETTWSLVRISAPGDTITQGVAQCTADSIAVCWPRGGTL